MTDLYIGNATRQVYDFSYCLQRGQRSPHSQKIQPGAQVKISGDLTQAQVDYILASHAKYGLIAEAEIDQAFSFHGTCYSVGKPIGRVRLMYLMETNLGELVKKGEEIRKINAIAHSEVVNTVNRQTSQADLPALEVTIQQENEDPRNDVPQMSEGLLISADPEAQPLSPGRRKRAA